MKKLTNYIDNHINPIVVKELRQAVNGRFVSGVLVLFLLISVIAILVALAADEGRSPEAGGETLLLINGILVITCLLFLPTYAGARLASEWSDTNVDLLFITTIKPRAIIWGKVLATTILGALIYSACMPFMMLTFLLRGIDLPSILIVLATGFLGVVVAIQFGVFAATISSSRGFRSLISLGVLAGLAVIAFRLIDHAIQTVERGIGVTHFWVQTGTWAACVLCLLALFNAFSVALISPVSANRALPVRLTMMAVWLVTGVLSFCWTTTSYNGDPILAWMLLSCVAFGCCTLIAVCERESWGPRLQRRIPRNALGRLCALLLYSGSVGGLMWSWLMAGLTMGIGAASVLYLGHWSEEVHRYLWASFGMILFGYTYALSALLLRKYVLGAVIRPEHTWSLALLLGALGCSLPWLLAWLLFGRDRWRHDEFVYIVNPYAMFMIPTRWSSLVFVGTWAGLVTIAALPSFIGQLRRFRPAAPSETGASDQTQAAPAA